MRRNYTVAIPALQYQQSKADSERGNVINLIIKHYADGVLTPVLDRLNVGTLLFLLIVQNCDFTFMLLCKIPISIKNEFDK